MTGCVCAQLGVGPPPDLTLIPETEMDKCRQPATRACYFSPRASCFTVTKLEPGKTGRQDVWI